MSGERFDFTAPVPSLESLGAVHLIAIGGAGMSALARLLLERGARVSGSDEAASPVLEALRAAGATVYVGHDPAHLGAADTVVVSSAVRESNPELRAARERQLPVLHRAVALAAATGGQRVVAVAGANGKTTTTAMLAVALAECGLDPSFAIGGQLAGTDVSARIGEGESFIVEADESDRSFLVYRPHVAVATSVQPDHLDFYGTAEGVEQAYRDFVATIRPGGSLVVSADDPGARRLGERARQGGLRTVTYGVAGDADVRVTEPVYLGLGSSATVLVGGSRHRLHLAVPGEHNLLNAAAALAAALEGSQASPEEVIAGLGRFAGTRRRFEVKGRARGVSVVDDYAHNPAKVQAVVSTAARMVDGSGRLVVVFQPHLFSRTRDAGAELGRALSRADVVVVMDVYGAREDPVPGVSGALVADAVRASCPACEVRFEPSWPAVAPLVASLTRPGDLVLTVGAGDVTRIGPQVLDLLAGQDRTS